MGKIARVSDRIYYHVINRARINGAHARAYNFLFSNISA